VGRIAKQTLFVSFKFRKRLGQFLRKKRGEMTFVEFGRKIGISASSLQRIETGQQNVTIDTLEQIVTRLKCETGEIFSGE